MPIKDLILQTLNYRRFHQSTPIPHETLLSLIDLARHSASGANLPLLKYIVSCDPDKNEIIFPHLVWGGYLKGWSGSVEGEIPSAYTILTDNK
ncbi:MAG: hypothetical protein KAH86_02855 [Methanosarcinales archaeon]|nr:hypothetical protein [Methanosarcinales archaeon]